MFVSLEGPYASVIVLIEGDSARCETEAVFFVDQKLGQYVSGNLTWNLPPYYQNMFVYLLDTLTPFLRGISRWTSLVWSLLPSGVQSYSVAQTCMNGESCAGRRLGRNFLRSEVSGYCQYWWSSSVQTPPVWAPLSELSGFSALRIVSVDNRLFWWLPEAVKCPGDQIGIRCLCLASDL